jgi:hypothetical protein
MQRKNHTNLLSNMVLCRIELVRITDNTALTRQDVERLYAAYEINTVDYPPDEVRSHNDVVDRRSNRIEVDN